MDDKIKKLECPFTWGSDEKLVAEFDDAREIHTGDEPLLDFIISVTSAYFAIKRDSQNGMRKLEVLDECWKRFRNCQQNLYGVSEKVLFHIKESTKYYLYMSANHKSEAKNILDHVEDGRNFCNPTDLATINGCKSVFFLKFFLNAYKKAIDLARLATLDNPECPLWYYMLAKGLRYARRHDYYKPSVEEENLVIKSYQLSTAPFYKIRLADMYKEKRDYSEAKIIYLEIYEADPKRQDVLLRLARALPLLGEFEKARVCFNKLEKYPNDFRYHYYIGLFFLKTKEYELAAIHFREATNLRTVYKIDLLQAWALSKQNKSFNFIGFLETILKKYEGNAKNEQSILLHIAMHYYFDNNDLQTSLRYILKAIEIDPKHTQLEKFLNTTIDYLDNRHRWYPLNIYDFAHEKLQEFNNHAKSMEKAEDIIAKLHHYVQDYRKSRSQKSCSSNS